MDFIGFEGSGYVPPGLPRDECEDRAKWRDYELAFEETANKTMQHPSFQPTIRVVNELEISAPSTTDTPARMRSVQYLGAKTKLLHSLLDSFDTVRALLRMFHLAGRR